ncbi:MAG TPA: GNAT family N-acetyltransferase [Candidatus Binatus sp.]|uniref:GNAT family N-acetyltransferase n=1 Tax=Candidatus Binatus sp. TaxID=2811406 RepID=UPI002F40EE6E
MADVKIRPAVRDDLPRLTEIYNYYIVNTPITFDLQPWTVEQRVGWFDEHSGTKRHRMLVAEDAGRVAGYACTGPFRNKAAYDTSVEASIYCAHDAKGRGIGATLYGALFAALKGEDINRLLGGITLPNEASVKLHRKFGFTDVGVFTECGRKFDRYWDVVWMERPLRLAGE